MFYQQRFSKYNNKGTFYNGYWYASKLEANYARELDQRKKGKEIKEWERQVVIPVIFYGEVFTKYKIDFKIIHNDDSVELIETKGYETDAWKYRWKALEIYCKHEMPDVKLSVVKG